ncbi:glycoside hydrolase superfamily, partial [Radiomyces spectabilis]|uniref:glycoside hydrolase superfamily n=1 Tax=Radiomyces spectabilis TaxID=64574 RepID=UPI002220D0A1
FDDSARPNTITPPLKEPFAYGKQPIRGVNLGGWLVLEPFITPSLFDQFPPSDHIVDEWTLCAKLGPEEAKRQLEHHYQTFVTEDDFQKMAKMGLNHVRIPIGHWAVEVFEGEPFVPKVAWKYLLKGIQWARKYGLRVMVELHTAPGSQNGWNHSGRYGQIGWLNGTNGEENGKRTLKIVEQMITFFNKPEWDHVTPIFGVLNEPAIFMLDKARVKDWYRESYDAIRNITGPDSGPILTYHEGFLGLTPWAGFFNTGYYRRVILETHTYLIFDKNLVSLPRNDQAIFACGSWQNDLKKSAEMNGPTMVGEFSAATNDCGKYLNGVGLGTRYEGTYRENTGEIRPPVCSNCTCKGVEDWKTWTDDYKHFLKAFIERQMDAFEASYGWLFWTYKTENHINPHWDYLLGWEQGWM